MNPYEDALVAAHQVRTAEHRARQESGRRLKSVNRRGAIRRLERTNQLLRDLLGARALCDMARAELAHTEWGQAAQGFTRQPRPARSFWLGFNAGALVAAVIATLMVAL